MAEIYESDIADLEAALRQWRTDSDALLARYLLVITALSKELRYCREQYAAQEQRLNTALARLEHAAPPCA